MTNPRKLCLLYRTMLAGFLPDSTTHSLGDAHAGASGSGDKEQSNDDLNPKSLLVAQIVEETAALCTLVELLLLHDCLARRPHGALLYASIDRNLWLLRRGCRQGNTGLEVSFVNVDIKMRFALGREVHGASCVRVLVEGGEGIRGVEVLVLFVPRRRHGRIVGRRRAERLLGCIEASDCGPKSHRALWIRSHCELRVEGCAGKRDVWAANRWM